jgi:hypothetical protein
VRDRFGFLERHGVVKSHSGQHPRGGGYRFVWRNRLLVAVLPVRDLLLCAKHLFVDASTSGKLNPGLNSRHHHATKVE